MKKFFKAKKGGKQCCVIFAALLLLTVLPWVTAVFQKDNGTTAVQAAASHVAIRFWDSSGTVQYGELRMKVGIGENAVLPQVPAALGYRAVGWSKSKNAASADYFPGKTIRVQKNISLYAVRNKIQYSRATFYNNKGLTSAKYKALTRTVESGSYIVLPEPPVVKGYQALGWATAKKASKAQYAAGKKLRLNKSTVFYAVYKKSKYYTVEFYNYNGKSNAAFAGLKSSVEENASLKLPELPEVDGYAGMGWSPVKSNSARIYQAGSNLKITKNTKLYGVYKKAVTITLCQQNGTVYKSFTVGKGTYYTIPAIANTSTSVFLGWDTSPGKTGDPLCQAGDRIVINNNIRLYAVRFKRSMEEDLTEADLLAFADWRMHYKQIVFVGDSRTVRMEAALKGQFGISSPALQDVHFVAESGQGLDWLKENGYPQLTRIVSTNTSEELPTAVIFNLGVNDLTRSGEFISYMEAVAAELQAKNCKLFFLSVNPVNSKSMAAHDQKYGTVYSRESKDRTEVAVRNFNNAMRSGLRSYTYIDTYTELMRTGFGTDAAKDGTDKGRDDGLHYGTKTSKRIYRYCLEFLLRG